VAVGNDDLLTIRLRWSAPVTNFRPLYDRVLVKRNTAPDRTVHGLYLPDVGKEKPLKATVVAVGIGRIGKDNAIYPLSVKVDDVVIFGKFAGDEVRINDEEYMILREEDILGVVVE
jgi:chaperonin GroES